MKKIIFLMFLCTSLAFAQNDSKGKISLKFKGIGDQTDYSIEAPVTSISINSILNKYTINARAEKNNEKSNVIVNLELVMNRIWSASKTDSRLLDSIMTKDAQIPLNLLNNFDIATLEIIGPVSFLMIKDETNRVGKYEDLNKKNLGIGSFVYATTKVVCKMSETKIVKTGNNYKITGKYIILLVNDKGSEGTSLIAEIKDGYFEFII